MPNLPHGTVTLVFTDVEGSTQLLQRLGDHYAHVLDDHRRLFREAVDACDGVVVDQRGDEFFVAFSDAGNAAEALVAAQRAFAEHEWPAGADLRVRMGMKEMGIGLAAAVLIDATIVRAVLLPATMKLLGEWNWYLPT